MFEGTPIESLGLKALLLLHYALPSPSPTHHGNGEWRESPRGLASPGSVGSRAFPTGRPLPATEAAAALGDPGKRAALLRRLLPRAPPPLPDDAFLPQCDVGALGPYPVLRLLLAVDARSTLALLARAFQVTIYLSTHRTVECGGGGGRR